MDKYLDILENLLLLEDEYEWLDFKENWFNKDEIGEYISAVANGACLCGKEYGYIIWGVKDNSRDIVGTSINFDKDINHEPYKHYLARNLKPSTALRLLKKNIKVSVLLCFKFRHQNQFKPNTKMFLILELDLVRKKSINFQNGNSS
ncbi:MAG: ATP-binding protein [Intestinibacter sp.]|uniref:AlbA family DNA-binding domain-containing protein n=1 Tax=Intestinibacter sp. TaxID=1965304 RepID=UPI002A82443A|nr:ATP-binding protein [Intestinibacter sp.]MDY4574803.1 ATP-binding protein [Intestinibacter sp.]